MLLSKEDSTSHPLLPLFFPVYSSYMFLLLSGALFSTSLALVFLRSLNKLTQHLAKNYFVVSLGVIYWGLLSWIIILQGQRSRTERNTKLTGGGQKVIALPLSTLASWWSSSSAPFNNTADEPPLSPGDRWEVTQMAPCVLSTLVEFSFYSTFYNGAIMERQA